MTTIDHYYVTRTIGNLFECNKYPQQSINCLRKAKKYQLHWCKVIVQGTCLNQTVFTRSSESQYFYRMSKVFITVIIHFNIRQLFSIICAVELHIRSSPQTHTRLAITIIAHLSRPTPGYHQSFHKRLEPEIGLQFVGQWQLFDILAVIVLAYCKSTEVL